MTAALAPVLVWFYREPRLREITFLMSLTFLIGGLRVQHTALLKRQMRFMALGIRDVVFLCPCRSACHHIGLTGSRLLGNRCSAVDAELYADGALVADGQVVTRPTATRG